MILVLGGTTEGRQSVAALEQAGKPFFYSTKQGEQDVPLHHGSPLSGAMTAEQMTDFCRKEGVRLLVDAAHPYAARLHHTVAETAGALQLPVVRYERHFPRHYDERIDWFPSYEAIVEHLLGSPRRGIVLATTGVQSIGRLQPLEARYTLRYRILRRDSSVESALRQGATLDQLCYYGEQSEADALDALHPDILLVKDSGESGGFSTKVDAALSRGIRVIALSRPALPATFHTVNGPYGLRRQVETLVPDFYPLHSGLTTGTYATAAALAAALRLLHGQMPTEVPVTLPDGEDIPVPVQYGDGYAFCVKVSGDDPDVTNGVEIRASVRPFPSTNEERVRPETASSAPIDIIGGEGIGRITLNGLDYPPGEAAINRVPRQMIRDNIINRLHPQVPLRVEISVPHGAELARRTFNPRIGIVGGISIVGSSGIIMPFSNDSFVSSIRRCMNVAKASGADRVVINSGAKSADFVRTLYPQLPPQAFVEYGNFIGEALHIADELGVQHLSLCIMIGKATKLAAGYTDTHSSRATIDTGLLVRIGRVAGVSEDLAVRISQLSIARDLWNIVPADCMPAFAKEMLRLCRQVCTPLFHGHLTIHLIHPPIKAVYTDLP